MAIPAYTHRGACLTRRLLCSRIPKMTSFIQDYWKNFRDPIWRTTSQNATLQRSVIPKHYLNVTQTLSVVSMCNKYSRLIGDVTNTPIQGFWEIFLVDYKKHLKTKITKVTNTFTFHFFLAILQNTILYIKDWKIEIYTW